MTQKFVDSKTKVEGFPSSWKKTKSISEVGCQTEKLAVTNIACQVSNKTDIGVQKDVETRDKLFGQVNDFKILAFLQRVEPFMSERLKANLNSNAFHGYNLIDDDDSQKQVECSLELRWPEQNQLSVRDVSWNSTGSVVAAAFGVIEHTVWCNHTGAVAVWSIYRSDLKPSEPTSVLNVDKCVTCTAFHPTEPSVIAGGVLSGEVYLWDLSWSDFGSPGVSSGNSAGSHEEAVTALRWVKAEGGLGGLNLPYHKHILVSSGIDGKVLLWKASPLSQEMKLLKKMLLRNSDIPTGTSEEVSSEFEVGVSALTFSSHDASQFVVGGEGGNVLVCSATAQTSVTGLGGGMEGFYNPMTLSFSPHDGQVSDTEWCPHHPKMFMTSSTDGQLRVYSTVDEQVEPSLILNMERSVCRISWSIVAPLVVVAGTSDGQVHLFNLKTTRDKPIISLPNTELTPVTGLAFNAKNSNVLAVGDGKGKIRIWKIHGDILKVTSTDAAYLKQLARENSVL